MGIEMTQRETRDDAIQHKMLVENTTGNADMEKLRGWLLGSQVKEMRSYRNYLGSGSRVRGCQLSDFISERACFLPVNMSMQPNRHRTVALYSCSYSRWLESILMFLYAPFGLCSLCVDVCRPAIRQTQNSMVIHFIWFLRALYFIPEVCFLCEFPQLGTKLRFLCLCDDKLGVAPPRLRVLLKFDFKYGWVRKEGWLLFWEWKDFQH